MKTVVCLGDSITATGRESSTGEQGYCQIVEKLLNEGGVEAKVVNAGIGGNTSEDGLGRLEPDVLAHHPDVVTVMFGTNDQNHAVDAIGPRVSLDGFEFALREIVRRVRLAGVECVLMTPPPISDAWFKRSEVPAFYHKLGASVMVGQYADRVRMISRMLNTPLVDMYAAFVQVMIAGADMDALIPDGVHPWAKGHEIMAREMIGEVAAALQPGCG